CAGDDGSARGFFSRRDDAWQGRLDEIHVAGAPPLRNLSVQAIHGGGGQRMTASLAAAATTLSPRLTDGRRIAGIEIRPIANGTSATLRFGVRDDFAYLARGLVARAETDHPAFAAHQPFRRRQVLELIATLLENPHDRSNDR